MHCNENGSWGEGRSTRTALSRWNCSQRIPGSSVSSRSGSNRNIQPLYHNLTMDYMDYGIVFIYFIFRWPPCALISVFDNSRCFCVRASSWQTPAITYWTKNEHRMAQQCIWLVDVVPRLVTLYFIISVLKLKHCTTFLCVAENEKEKISENEHNGKKFRRMCAVMTRTKKSSIKNVSLTSCNIQVVFRISYVQEGKNRTAWEKSLALTMYCLCSKRSQWSDASLQQQL